MWTLLLEAIETSTSNRVHNSAVLVHARHHQVLFHRRTFDMLKTVLRESLLYGFFYFFTLVI